METTDTPIEITQEEWVAGTRVGYFEPGPSSWIEIRRCAGGLIQYSVDHWVGTHKRITEDDLITFRAYLRKIGAR